MHILLIRPDHLGDILLTSPAVSHLRHALPAAHLSYLVRQELADVPTHFSAVDATYSAPFPALRAPFDPVDWGRVAAREAEALRGRFDLALLTRPDDPWSGMLVEAAAIPRRLGYAHPRTRPFLTEALPVPTRKHAAAIALDLARAATRELGVTVAGSEGERPCFRTSSTEEAEADQALADVPGSAGGSPVLLHPGSGWVLKNWPPHRWGQLAAALSHDLGIIPIVVAGPGERRLVESVIRASQGNACGLAAHLSTGALAAMYRRCRLVIGTDSGALHLAALAGAPVVGLYGPADPAEFAPLCPPGRCRIVRVQLPCSPCRTLLDPPCGAYREPRCVTAITVSDVLTAAADLLSSSAVGAVADGFSPSNEDHNVAETWTS